MREHVLSETDTLETLSAAYGVPVCMVMRANGFLSGGSLADIKSLKIPGRCYCIKQNEALRDKAQDIPYIEYEVQDGETIFDIAQRHKTTMNIIARLNYILDPVMLTPGQKIKILELPKNCEKYSVKTVDHMEDIARRFNVPEKCIRSYNCLRDNDSIYPGMQLMIPRST